jgi:cytochrome P450
MLFNSFILCKCCTTAENLTSHVCCICLQGYETTSVTIAYAVYCIAAHPEVEERLLREIDAVGRDDAVGHADVDKASGPLCSLFVLWYSAVQ